MINLIPNEEKKKMVQDFRSRLLVVFVMALGVTFLIGSAALLPAYFLSKIKTDIANTKLVEQQKSPLPKLDQNTTATVEELNNKFTLLDTASSKSFHVTQKVINEIVLNKMPEIKITQISYTKDASSSKLVSVRGFAPSRDSLLKFRFILQNNPNFKNVDLPISNFIKGSNIQFFLTLSTAEI